GGRRQVFEVFVVGADIADMREGEGDDLAGIGRIREDFLIAGQRRVEDDFRDRRSGGAEAAALDYRAVGENEDGGGFFDGPAGGRCGQGALLRASCARPPEAPYMRARARRRSKRAPCPVSFPAKARYIRDRRTAVNLDDLRSHRK